MPVLNRLGIDILYLLDNLQNLPQIPLYLTVIDSPKCMLTWQINAIQLSISRSDDGDRRWAVLITNIITIIAWKYVLKHVWKKNTNLKQG